MSFRSRISGASLALLLAALLLHQPVAAGASEPLASPQGDAERTFEPMLSGRQQEQLGAAIAKLFEAQRKEEGTLTARDELIRLVADLERRDRQGRSLLASMADLEAALRLSLGHRDTGVRKGRILSEDFVGSFGGKIEYALYAPQRYRVQSGPYPLILAIPDAGMSPEDHLRQHWSSREVRENAIVAAIAMPEDQALWDAVGSLEQGGGIPRLLLTFARVRDSYAIDFDRVFLAGRGAGVAPAVRMAGLFPDRFAGVIGRSGDPDDVEVVNYKHVPSFFAGGGPGATAFQERVQAAGHDNVTLSAEAEEADIWEWLSELRRPANPSEVHLAPLDRTGSSAYWVELLGADPADGPNVHASIERSTNTVTVRARNVPALRLFFNDRLVDLDKPVRVVLNGVEHEHRFERSLLQTVNRAFTSLDPGRIYTVQRDYDVVPAATEE